MKKGFTFIEILVVVTIIAILILVGVVSYSSITQKSRDTRRISDLEQIRSALEMYRADYGYYPDAGTRTEFGIINENTALIEALTSYLPVIPSDPKDNVNYPYQIQMTDGLPVEDPLHYYGYCLAAYTESSGSVSNTCGHIELPLSPNGSNYSYGVKNP